MLRKTILLVFLVAVQLWARDNGPKWIEVHSEHFTVVTDGGDTDGRHVLDQFERMRWVFQTMFPNSNVDPVSPIVVIAVKDKKDMQALEPAAYLGKGKLDLAGYFMRTPDKNYIMMRLDVEGEHPYSTVYHEYTHLELGTEGMPLWLNEGLAEFFQNTEFKNNEVLMGEPSQDNLLYLQQNKLIPLDVLFRVDANSPYYHEEQKGSVFYAESWALTHYLFTLDFNDKVNRIGNYLKLVNQHVDPVTAAQQAFGDLKKLQSTLDSYTNRMSYNELKLSSAAAPIDPKTMQVKPITLPQADAFRADVLALDGRTVDAEALLEPLLKADPNNVLAHETEGYLARKDGKMEEAKKWYGEAVALDSQSFLAQYYFGAISLMGGSTTPEAEASLRKAIELNKRFAPAYDALAVLYARRRENLDEAHMLSVTAVSLEPSTTQYRMDAAYVLMQMQRFDDALRVLQVAKETAKSTLEADVVQTRINEAQQYQAQEERRKQYNAQQEARAKAMGQPTGPGAAAAEDAAPKHPSEKPHGPTLTAQGVIHGVTCSYPVVMEFQLAGPKGKLSLYNNNYYDIEFSAANFTPQGELQPCKELEGMKAKVQYFATADKTVDGQIVSVEMSK
jgi:tetratricopeptide (TPR) repeat protein